MLAHTIHVLYGYIVYIVDIWVGGMQGLQDTEAKDVQMDVIRHLAITSHHIGFVMPTDVVNSFYCTIFLLRKYFLIDCSS